MDKGTRILLVEDDRSIAGFVEPELQHLGFHVICRYDGVAGLEAARTFSPDLIILDIILPQLDGVGVLKRLREEGSRVPIIMLTARDTTLDKVHSLDLGADDYLTKPFDIEELLARIRALLRRAEGEEVLRIADLEINLHPRGEADGSGDRADGPRVRAARVHGQKSSAGALARVPPLAGVGGGIRPDDQPGRCLRLLPQEKGRRARRDEADPHRSRGRIRPEGGLSPCPSGGALRCSSPSR
jgi:CheY-like chemotaxis protein